MSYIPRRCAVWIALALSLLPVDFGWAEFTVGAALPEFSLSSADGSSFSLTKQGDSILPPKQ